MRPVDAEFADGVAWSVCLSVSLSVTVVSPAKTNEPMEMPFGMWNHVLDGLHTGGLFVKLLWPLPPWGDGGGGHWLVWKEWRPAGWSVSASVNLPLHHKVQKFSSGTGSPGWSRKKGRKTVVVVWYFGHLCVVVVARPRAGARLYVARSEWPPVKLLAARPPPLC